MAGFNREYYTRRMRGRERGGREEGEREEVNQAAALSDLVILLSYVTHKSVEIKENDKADRRKELACAPRAEGAEEVVFI